jgi:hypothetical protein
LELIAVSYGFYWKFSDGTAVVETPQGGVSTRYTVELMVEEFNDSHQYSIRSTGKHIWKTQKRQDPNRFTVSASQLLSKRWCNDHRDGFVPRKKRIETNAGW